MDFDAPVLASVRPTLLLAADPVLRSNAIRIAAAADSVVLERDLPVGKLPDAASLHLEWDDAATVLLDIDAARAIVELRLPRREDVVVLARDGVTVEHWRIATAVGAGNVFELPLDEESLIRLLGSSPQDVRSGGGVVTVVGARGGAGSSTFAAALAITASERGTRTLLVDGDDYGAGLDLLLGWEDDPGLRWAGLVVEAGRISGDSLHGALPSRGSLAVLAAGRATTGGIGVVAGAAVVDAGRRAGDLVVCDVPRIPGALTHAFHDAADLVVLVVPAELGAVAGAENVAGYLASRNANLGLVVRGPAPGGLRATEIADALGLPLLASMRPEPGLARRLERGGLRLGTRSPLGEAAASVVSTFHRRPLARRAA